MDRSQITHVSHILRLSYEYIVFYILLAAFGISALVWSLIATIFFTLPAMAVAKPKAS